MEKSLSDWFTGEGIDPSNLESRYENNDTALHIASRKGHFPAVSWLLEKGADPNPVNNDGNGPLWHACYAGSAEIVRLLVEKGARVNSVNDNNTSALMYCSSSGRTEMVELLLSLGADKNLENLDGFRAIDHATTPEILRMLK